MKQPAELHLLLDEVLTEGAQETDHDEILEGLLSQVRRQRQRRNIKRSVVPLLAMLGVISLLWLRTPGQWSTTSDCLVVQNQSLPRIPFVSTQRLSPSMVVGSFHGIDAVQTDHIHSEVFLIDDRELLALVSPRTAILLRTGPSSSELYFLDSEVNPRGLPQ